ncbi:alpha/beta fold hydrolase [Amnibacterium endophyticum]|uniref:Alpha/beta fold hydrolase n=1 Tax=Amnibacterium endophyticum TaxID=2109337 RepID=A0ABW4LGD6_9MICO
MADAMLEVTGARLAADVRRGSGPAVVALHGLGSSRANEDADGFFGWTAVAEAGRTLVRYDARGHGRSSGAPQPAAYRWEALADDLLAVLDEVSPDEPVDGIGVSMGTGTLLTLAVRRPERFRRLVLVLPPTAWSSRAAQRDLYESSARFVEQRGMDAWVRGTASLPGPPVAEEAGAAALPPDVDGALLPSVLRGAAGSDLPPEADVAGLEHDVLLMPWTGDPGHPMSTAERLLELLPNAALDVMRDGEALRGAGGRAAAFLTR